MDSKRLADVLIRTAESMNYFTFSLIQGENTEEEFLEGSFFSNLLLLLSKTREHVTRTS